MNSYWVYKDKILKWEDSSHFIELIKNYKDFDLSEEYINNIFKKLGFSSNNIDYLSDFYKKLNYLDWIEQLENKDECTKISEELISKVVEKGALRIFESKYDNSIYIIYFKYITENQKKLLLDNLDLFDKNKKIILISLNSSKEYCYNSLLDFINEKSLF